MAVGAAVSACLRLVRPRITNWGATREEVERPMPMDDDIERPQVVTNRAISICAPAEAVWPWLVQMGELPRGGFYSHTAVERALGMKVENAKALLDGLPELHVGDALDRGGSMLVKGIVPGECLVLGPPKGLDIDTTWALAVYPAEGGGCRLVSRVRVQYRRWTPFTVFALLMLEPGQFIMERKMLLEVKRLVEGAQCEA
jgi:hypothetical protein